LVDANIGILLVASQLRQAPGGTPGGAACSHYPLDRRTGAVTLQQPDDAMVHAAQRDLAQTRLNGAAPAPVTDARACAAI